MFFKRDILKTVSTFSASALEAPEASLTRSKRLGRLPVDSFWHAASAEKSLLAGTFLRSTLRHTEMLAGNVVGSSPTLRSSDMARDGSV